jgi:Ca2+-binding RTX toxin-like protein
VAALMLQARPNLTPEEIKNLLQASSTDEMSRGYDDVTGSGLINAYLAVRFAETGTIKNPDQQILSGTHLADDIVGSDRDDTLTGYFGPDILEGKGGNDVLNGGASSDTASYESAPMGVNVDLSITGPQNTVGAGTDTLISIENLAGSAYGDVLHGDFRDNDLFGNAGDDYLVGGLGQDMLQGGAGNDHFVFNSILETTAAAPDRIMDFSTGDLIDLGTIDADTTAAGNQAFHVGATGGHAGDIVAVYDSVRDRTTVSLYTDHDTTADGVIVLDGNHAGLTGADFVL